jgi:adenylate kinase family enzyme
MGRYIAKLADDAYVDWSTVVDAPVSWVLAREAAVKEWTEERIARADRNGTSILDGYPAGYTPEEIVSGNRAGPGEAELSVAEILQRYANAEAYEAAGGVLVDVED